MSTDKPPAFVPSTPSDAIWGTEPSLKESASMDATDDDNDDDVSAATPVVSSEAACARTVSRFCFQSETILRRFPAMSSFSFLIFFAMSMWSSLYFLIRAFSISSFDFIDSSRRRSRPSSNLMPPPTSSSSASRSTTPSDAKKSVSTANSTASAAISAATAASAAASTIDDVDVCEMDSAIADGFRANSC